MTLHYHGTPICPQKVLETLAGKHFCVSFARPQNVKWCHDFGQSVLLDNGAFRLWQLTRNSSTGAPRSFKTDWRAYYAWAETWLSYHTTWAIIPDIIEGDEAANDALLAQWPFRHRGAPVWHMHESISRLERLTDTFPRVCLGSSGQFAIVGSDLWRARMDEALNAVCRPHCPAWLHMLRGMQCSQWGYPFASVDSTDIARNHWRLTRRDPLGARLMADRWDSHQCPAIWQARPQQAQFWEAP